MPSTPIRERLGALIARIERVARVDVRYLVTNGAWLTGEQILLGLMAFCVSIAFAHFVSKEAYGTYRFLLSLFWTFAAFSLTGVPTALIRAIAKKEEGAFGQAIRLTLLGALPLSLVALGVALYYIAHGNQILAGGMVLIALISPLYQTGYLYASFFEGRKDFKTTVQYGIIVNAVPAIGLLLLMPFARTPLPFFAMYLVGGALTGVCLTALTYFRAHPNKVTSDELTKFSFHLSANNILGTVATQLDSLLLFHFVGPAALAVYAFATAIPDQLKSMVSNLSNLAMPKFVHRTLTDIRLHALRRTLVLTVLLILATLCYLVIAPWVFHIFFPSYANAIWYSELYMCTLIPIGSIIPITVFQAHAAHRELYLYNTISSVLQIVILVVGVTMYGLIGLILARGASRLASFILGFWLLGAMKDSRPT